MKFSLRGLLLCFVLLAAPMALWVTRIQFQKQIERAKLEGYVTGSSAELLHVTRNWMLYDDDREFQKSLQVMLIFSIEGNLKNETRLFNNNFIGSRGPLELTGRMLKLLDCDTPDSFRRLVSMHFDQNDFFDPKYHDSNSHEFQLLQNFLERSLAIPFQDRLEPKFKRHLGGESNGTQLID